MNMGKESEREKKTNEEAKLKENRIYTVQPINKCAMKDPTMTQITK
jgi:hypothetical protein